MGSAHINRLEQNLRSVRRNQVKRFRNELQSTATKTPTQKFTIRLLYGHSALCESFSVQTKSQVQYSYTVNLRDDDTDKNDSYTKTCSLIRISTLKSTATDTQRCSCVRPNRDIHFDNHVRVEVLANDALISPTKNFPINHIHMFTGVLEISLFAEYARSLLEEEFCRNALALSDLFSIPFPLRHLAQRAPST